jgi:DNA polymerase (family 10)
MLASTFSREARRAGVALDSITPVGSLRRFSPDVGDISLLGTAPRTRHEQVLDSVARLPIVAGVASREASSVTVRTDRGEARLLLAEPEHAGSALVWHTGSRAHVVGLQARAERMGLAFTDACLRRNGHVLIAPAEEDFYRHLELPVIAPELREGEDALDAAERGALPELISNMHIRGDLHMHSTWSDGRDTMEDMVLASRQLGYEYVAITDHSERAWSARKLMREEVPRQREEVEALRTRFAGLQILHGVEVDIMHDGSLDFDDELLAGFDIVLASLHDHGGHDRAWLTERYVRAIRHPLVNVITHPANRSPAHSPGYDVDFDRLFEEAAATGTALEIDGAPGHLDMDGTLARRAALAGATIVVDSDCHRADALARQMRWGVGTARRGWLEPRHVLNTRSVHDVRAFIARKRQRA